MRRFALALVALSGLVSACDMGSSARPEPKPMTTSSPVTASSEKFGTAIDPKAQEVALADVAKDPAKYTDKTFATTGTVTAVCQHRGCWMEIKDDAGEAHIKMAGHAFFVPRTASGKKARVLATLVKSEAEGSCGDHAAGDHEKGKGCKAEAEAQLGRPLAKLELVAKGVELL
jgi:hypothetical protein